MHRVVQEQIERILATGTSCRPSAIQNPAASRHLSACAECRRELHAMQDHSGLLRQLHVAESEIERLGVEPRSGFYARVMERIEAEGPASIWNLFMESAFGKRIAMASLALAVVLGVYLVSSEHTADDPIIAYTSGASQSAADAATPIQVTVQTNLTPAAQSAQTAQPDEEDPFEGMQTELLQNQLPITGAAYSQPADDAVLTNLMTYREQ